LWINGSAAEVSLCQEVPAVEAVNWMRRLLRPISSSSTQNSTRGQGHPKSRMGPSSFTAHAVRALWLFCCLEAVSYWQGFSCITLFAVSIYRCPDCEQRCRGLWKLRRARFPMPQMSTYCVRSIRCFPLCGMWLLCIWRFRVSRLLRFHFEF